MDRWTDKFIESERRKRWTKFYWLVLILCVLGLGVMFLESKGCI
jgi:hypothetical protein